MNGRPSSRSEGTPELIGRALAWWVGAVDRRPLAVVLGALVAAGFLLAYTASHLGVNTDTADMLSRELPWRQTYIAYKEAFPQYADEIAVVLDGATPEIADRARSRLAAALRKEEGLFRGVYVPGGGPFFERNGLLYLSTTDLQELADELAAIQPFLGRLEGDPSLGGFFSMLDEALEAAADGEEIDLVPVLERVGEAFGAAVDGRFYRLSWQELMLGRAATLSERRRFLVLQARQDFSELLPGKAALRRVREAARDLELDPDHGVRVRLTGSVAMEDEELESVGRGAGLAGLASLVMVGLLLFAALRSVRLVGASLLTLVVGLVGTAAFAAWAVGHLNLISVAFAVLYIGLGIDYAIHLCSRYRELRQQGRDRPLALREAVGDVGASLALCAVTTAAGFYAFVPTAYAGVSELGVISGSGMFISLVVSVTLLPALLSLGSPKAAGEIPSRPSRTAKLLALPLRHVRAVRWGALLLGALAAALLPRVRFDYNPTNLRDPHTESVATYNELLEDSDSSPLTIALLEPDARAAREAADRVEALDRVDKALTIESFVPRDQDEKLMLIDEMALILGPELEDGTLGRPTEPGRQLESVGELERSLEGLLPRLEGDLASSTRRLLEDMRRFQVSIRGRTSTEQAKTVEALRESLLADLPELLERLRTSMEAEPVGIGDLPSDLVARWVTGDGRHRVEVFPEANLADNRALRRFVEQVRTVEPDATGAPVVSLEAGDAVVRAFQQAFLYALAFVCILLLTLLRSVRDTLLVLVPLLLAGALTGAASVVLDIPFNFANVIALPLLLGVGVDNGIHMVHRFRTTPPEDGNLLGTSTARAVFFSALTTIASFGNLAFSSHLGMASMGQLLSLGLGLTLVSTLVVLPALLTRPAP